MKTLELFPAQERNEQLVSVNNNRVVTTSLRIAEYFSKAHKDVLKAISNLETTKDFQERNFSLSFYTRELPNGGSKKEPMYYITRDGFTLLAMGFTGKKAMQFKIAYINAFNEMEEMLQKQECTRYAEKLIDVEIQKFNKRLKEAALQVRQKNGADYGPYGEIQTGVYSYKGMPLKEKLRNIFSQLSNAYVEAYCLSGKYLSMKKQHEELRRFLSIVGGKMGEAFSIFPDL